MPFGLKTVVATLQRLMQATFSDFFMGNVTGSSDNQTGFCMPCVDDLIVLGHIATANGRILDPKKVHVISDFLMVNTHTTVQKFLGMVGFYRHYILSFAQKTYHPT